MTKRNKKVIVVVPHRISGFFEIVDQINGVKLNNPVQIGSRGAGFNLSAVGRTEVIIKEVENYNDIKCPISINNRELNEKAETTYYILNNIKKYLTSPIKITINHVFDLPVGCGYGASGSGALGTIYGLNQLLNLNLSDKEKGRIAHIAEVVNKTGLGTVCGQMAGGLCILKEPGYPCKHVHINFPGNIMVICGSFGMIHTKSILNSNSLSLRIKKAGRIALQKLIHEPNIKTFIKASIEFVKETDILNILSLTNIKELMDDLNKLDIIGASMNQLGRSVYAICKKKDEKKALDVFQTFQPGVKIFNLSISNQKPQIFVN